MASVRERRLWGRGVSGVLMGNPSSVYIHRAQIPAREKFATENTEFTEISSVFSVSSVA
jgi:hypothetical protein